jgi:hypothetical protein
MTEPTFSGKRSTISVNFSRIVTVGGLKVRVELEPGCWVTGSRLGLLASHRVAGSARLTSRRTFEKATEADLEAMIRRLRVVRCRFPGCKSPNLVGDGREPGNPKAYCERHRLQDIVAAAAKVQAKLDAKKAQADDAAYRRGFRYMATIWIHQDGGDDTYAVLYFAEKPTAALIRKLALRRGSRLPDDFRIEPLRPVSSANRNRK